MKIIPHRTGSTFTAFDRKAAVFYGRVSFVALLFVMSLALAGCVPIPPPSLPQPSGGTVPLPTTQVAEITARAPISGTNLQIALSYAPITTTLVGFTDWTVIKAIEGAEGLTSESSLEERVEFIRRLGSPLQFLASQFGKPYISVHAETWGWDSTDLLWEAYFALNGPPAHILRLRDDLDLAPFFAHLVEREYTQSEYGGLTIYHHRVDLKADWIRTSDFAILNVAYLADENILVLAAAPNELRVILDAINRGESLADRADINSLAGELGDVASVFLSPLGCGEGDMYPGEPVPSEITEEQIQQFKERTGVTGNYSTHAVGYRVDVIDGEEWPLGVVMLHYPSYAEADADVLSRWRLAELGQSYASDRPYTDIFEVADVGVVPADETLGEEGAANLYFLLYPHEESPLHFLKMYIQNDLLFAVCGGM